MLPFEDCASLNLCAPWPADSSSTVDVVRHFDSLGVGPAVPEIAVRLKAEIVALVQEAMLRATRVSVLWVSATNEMSFDEAFLTAANGPHPCVAPFLTVHPHCVHSCTQRC